jgi:hypothetical protein
VGDSLGGAEEPENGRNADVVSIDDVESRARVCTELISCAGNESGVLCDRVTTW